jgi:hypothetical protein
MAEALGNRHRLLEINRHAGANTLRFPVSRRCNRIRLWINSTGMLCEHIA